MWLRPPPRTLADSPNSAMKALQAGSPQMRCAFLVSSTNLRLPGFMTSSIHSPAHGTTLYHHHPPPPKRGNGLRGPALAAPRVCTSSAAALKARLVMGHRIWIRIMRCFHDPQESCSAKFGRNFAPRRCLQKKLHAAASCILIYRSRRSSLSKRYNPNCYASCTNTPTDNRTLGCFESRGSIAVYVPKEYPATEVRNSAKIADCMPS